jgi:hypothetical protein
MSDLETRLAAALHADTPPERDAVFRIEVLLRLEAARFRRQVRRTFLVATLLAILAVMSLPTINAWMIAGGQRLGFVALGALTALCVLSVAINSPRLRTGARAVGRLLYPYGS